MYSGIVRIQICYNLIRGLYHIDLLPMYRRPEIAMTQKSKSQEGKRNRFGEEYTPYFCRNVCKCIPYTSNDNIFEPSGLLYEWSSLGLASKTMVVDEGYWEFDNCKYSQTGWERVKDQMK